MFIDVFVGLGHILWLMVNTLGQINLTTTRNVVCHIIQNEPKNPHKLCYHVVEVLNSRKDV